MVDSRRGCGRCAGSNARVRSAAGGPGKTELTRECQAFRGTLGAKVLVLKPREPEHKGIIERAHDYLERSFLPGRRFTDPADFNAQLQQWLAVVNARPRRALG